MNGEWNETRLLEWLSPCNDYTQLFEKSNGCGFLVQNLIYGTEEKGKKTIQHNWLPLQAYTVFTHTWFWVPVFILAVASIGTEIDLWNLYRGRGAKYLRPGAALVIGQWILVLGIFFGVRDYLEPGNRQDAELCAPKSCEWVNTNEYWRPPSMECSPLLDYTSSYADSEIGCDLVSSTSLEIATTAAQYCLGIHVEYSNDDPAQILVKMASHPHVQLAVEQYKNQLAQIEHIWKIVCGVMFLMMMTFFLFLMIRHRRHEDAQVGQVVFVATNQPTICTANFANKHQNEPCTICTDPFVADETLSFLACGHVFHQKCIDEWGKHNAVCPICRLEFIPI